MNELCITVWIMRSFASVNEQNLTETLQGLNPIIRVKSPESIGESATWSRSEATKKLQLNEIMIKGCQK